MIIYNAAISKSLQISEHIKEYIKEHSLKQGDKLPSIATFASMFSASKDSVNEAMTILSYEGTVVIKPRHGVFVAGGAWKNLYPMTPDWHNLTSKSPQKPDSEASIKLFKSISANNKRSLSMPLINSSFFPEIIQKGLKGASELSSKKDLDLWFAGALPLREKLCEYMGYYGLSVSSDQVIIMNGVIDALNAICITTMHPGMDIIYGIPSYVPAQKRLASYGISMSGIEMDHEGIKTNAILKSLTGSLKKMVYIAPSFSNPTGIVTSIKRRKEILTICNNAKTPIIEVDSYRELSDDLPVPIAALDNTDSVIYVGSIREMLPSGSYLSWIVAPPAIIDRFKQYQNQSDFPSRLTQLFFYSILESGELYKYKKQFQEFLAHRRAFTESVFQKYLRGKATWNSNGHPIIYLVKPNEGIDLEKIYNAPGLFLYRGSEYWHDFDNYLTISSMHFSEEEFIKSIKRLAELM